MSFNRKVSDLGHFLNFVLALDISVEIEKVLDCTVIIKSSEGASGNGIIVTSNKIVTALHGLFGENDHFDIIDRHGHLRAGLVKKNWYSANIVDIALIVLNPGSAPFESFMPVHTTPVKLGSELGVMSRRAVPGTDEYTECYEKSNVNAIIKDTSIFHSTYYAEAGMSGCGVVTVPAGNRFALAGVHVASHDKTEAVDTLESDADADTRPSKKRARTTVTREEFNDAMMTVNSNIHGHGSYCLICEVSRVDGLLDLIHSP